MSLTITLIDSANNTKNVVVPNGYTFNQILAMDEVEDLFSDTTADDAVVAINDTDITEGGRLADMLRGAEAQSGDTIEFDAEFDMDEEDLAEELDGAGTGSADAPTVSSTVGHVIVQISGGIISVKLAITPGVTTLADALSNSAVQVRSGMSAAQLAEATVQYQGSYYNDAASRRGAILRDGTVIDVNPRQASTKG